MNTQVGIIHSSHQILLKQICCYVYAINFFSFVLYVSLALPSFGEWDLWSETNKTRKKNKEETQTSNVILLRKFVLLACFFLSFFSSLENTFVKTHTVWTIENQRVVEKSFTLHFYFIYLHFDWMFHFIYGIFVLNTFI